MRSIEKKPEVPWEIRIGFRVGVTASGTEASVTTGRGDDDAIAAFRRGAQESLRRCYEAYRRAEPSFELPIVGNLHLTRDDRGQMIKSIVQFDTAYTRPIADCIQKRSLEWHIQLR